MKLKEYLKEKKEHRNSESFFCHKSHFGLNAILILGIPFIIVYLSSNFNFSFPEIFFLIILALVWISAFYVLIFEYPAFLYTTDSQLVVWDNFFKKRSIEKNQIKKAYVFDDRHASSTKLKNILRLELNDGNFFDVCLEFVREKNEAAAMVIISALRCPYESEYEQKTITKLDDEDKEILKKEKKQYNLTLILASVYYVILFCFQWKYQFFNEETMDYAIYAPVFACLIYIFFLYNNRKD
jgi:cell division protein FtsW (lipid II flippase)